MLFKVIEVFLFLIPNSCDGAGAMQEEIGMIVMPGILGFGISCFALILGVFLMLRSSVKV